MPLLRAMLLPIGYVRQAFKIFTFIDGSPLHLLRGVIELSQLQDSYFASDSTRDLHLRLIPLPAPPPIPLQRTESAIVREQDILECDACKLASAQADMHTACAEALRRILLQHEEQYAAAMSQQKRCPCYAEVIAVGETMIPKRSKSS